MMKPKESGSGSIRRGPNSQNGSGERIKTMGTQIKQLFLGKQSPNAGVAYSQSKRGGSNGAGAGSSGANTLISTGMP